MTVPVNTCTYQFNSTNYCISCTGQPYVQATPDGVQLLANAGWNGGANSITALSGDLHALWNTPVVAGAVVGITRGRRSNVADFTAIDYGIYAFTFNNVLLISAMRNGVLKGPTIPYNSTELEIRRAHGQVLFIANGTTFYGEVTDDASVMTMAAAIYNSGDLVQ